MNFYATLTEVKREGQGVQVTGTSYDTALVRLLAVASDLVERTTGWYFYPWSKTVHQDIEQAGESVWLAEPLLAATTIQASNDYGQNYNYTLTLDTSVYATNGTDGGYGRYPYRKLVLAYNNTVLSAFVRGQRALKIAGVWGWHDDYDNAWENSQDTVEDNPLSASATSLTVNDADGVDQWGLTPRFQVGQLLRIESEYVQVTAANTSTNVLTIVRGRNGTTAAAHDQNTQIDVWRPVRAANQATIIQAARWFKRSQQAWQDAGAAVELGQLIYTQQLDPDVKLLLFRAGLMKVGL